ncbi:acyl-CoA synthetase (AMP-forming)/AMP-acid ligase II [Oxalobacteraceae bacterium GrIS 1.11]
MPSLNELIDAGLDDAVALAGVVAGAAPLHYAALRELTRRTGVALNRAGIGRNDRVAIVLPNGPEMAASFIAVACAATCAPLNPAYRADEFEFYLSDLHAKALIVERGSQSAAIAVAQKLGVAIIELCPDPQLGAGAFILDTGELSGIANLTGMAQAGDIGLILHTSGTTSRPKIVPLTHGNLCNSARNVAHTTQFTAADKGLNIMPLFHIHGLIAGILAPLSRGGSVACSPGFNALKFFGWLDEVSPTWYTAVPTMHQAILSRAGQNAAVIARAKLRFIRSSSASLPTRVLAELEEVFRAPVIEAYGMTEAAHQMACNPLPPARRKPGTVGLAGGPEVAIMDADGALLAAGAIGEIVVRGDNITPGYENNPQANAQAFCHGWFRTGDQGQMDADGYLSLTGRLKEIINRGGEKISPLEVDEVLMAHPAVAQVVTFAIPDDKLGEEVGAVVVLREAMTATEREIRDFAGEKLASYKVPKKVLFMDEIPKGATGKLQRIGLARKLGLG